LYPKKKSMEITRATTVVLALSAIITLGQYSQCENKTPAPAAKSGTELKPENPAKTEAKNILELRGIYVATE
jgi:hypothetical protein